MEKTEKTKKGKNTGAATVKAASADKTDGTTFEAAMDRLEKIVRQMEAGNATLDESLALFEEGVGLVKLCNRRLDDAEQRVGILTAGADGALTEQPFSVEGQS